MELGVKSLLRFAFAILGIASVLGLPAGPARAQSRPGRALRAVSVDETDTGWRFVLELDFPVRYLRHAPETPTRVLRIQVAPVERGGDEIPETSQRENLPVPRDRSGPLLDVFYDGSEAGAAVVELQFTQTLAFQVVPGKDLRSLEIRADLPAARTAAGAGDAKTSALLVRARHAIRDGELDLAIALLSRVLELPEASVPLELRMDARELLGVTHERRGQLAHAAAEYETYLAQHAEGPAAERVRQRLETIRTATAAPEGALRPATPRRSGSSDAGIAREGYGTVGARYYRTEARESDTGLRFAASDFLTDLSSTGRLETDRWEVRGDFVGTYDLDLENAGRSDDLRISRASTRIDDRVHGIEATFGRQRRSDGGVLGRFDGIHTTARLGSGVRVSALAGMPIARWSDAVPDANTWVFGGAVSADQIGLEGLQGQLFAVGQRAFGMTDRSAIGGELRYATDATYSFAYVDYDFVFNTLNTFLVSTTWRATVDTDLRASVERRNAPVVTLQSALQGQDVDDLGDLERILSESDIRDLALDRTAVAWTGMVGATHRLSDRYQLSGDFSVNHISGTDSSVGVVGVTDVPGAEASGPDFATTIALLVSDWLVENGVGSISLRYFEGEMYRSFMTLLYSRFTLIGTLRASPRLRFELRDSELQGQRSRLRPSFELGWRHGPWSVFGEAGGEWEEPLTSGSGAARELGYFVEAGMRWDF